MKKVLAIFVAFFCITGAVNAGNNFNFNYDYAYFAAEGNKIFVELYYSFNQNELTFKKNSSGYEAKGKILLDLFSNGAGKNIIMKELNIPLQVSDTVIKASKLTGQLNMMLDTGTYKLILKASDYFDTSKSASSSEEIVLKSIPDNVFTSSSIQLSTGISKSSDVNNIFYKNSLEVIPNPSLLFGNNLSKVYYYMELYNIRQGLISDSYTVNICITDTDGKELKSETKNYKIKSESRVEYGAVDISDIPSSRYIFVIKALDDKNTEVLKAFKYFYIYNSNVIDTNTHVSELDAQYMASEYPQMSEKNVEEEHSKAIYLLTGKDQETWEKINDLESKRKFMFYIWKRFDPNPATVVSEFKKEYFERIKFANEAYTDDFRAGWKTDRGRIYCIYGKFDDIERHAYEGSTRAYEIWTYHNVQGGIIFVFVDESAGYGNFELVHSTSQYEIHNDLWKEKLNVK
jgi:GWxTD domain-containing protein